MEQTLELTAQDLDEIARYRQLRDPSPEAEAFLSQLPSRVRREVLDVIIRERRRAAPVVSPGKLPLEASLLGALFPDGLPWRTA